MDQGRESTHYGAAQQELLARPWRILLCIARGFVLSGELSIRRRPGCRWHRPRH